jgi:hypothetical protein
MGIGAQVACLGQGAGIEIDERTNASGMKVVDRPVRAANAARMGSARSVVESSAALTATGSPASR